MQENDISIAIRQIRKTSTEDNFEDRVNKLIKILDLLNREGIATHVTDEGTFNPYWLKIKCYAPSNVRFDDTNKDSVMHDYQEFARLDYVIDNGTIDGVKFANNVYNLPYLPMIAKICEIGTEHGNWEDRKS